MINQYIGKGLGCSKHKLHILPSSPPTSVIHNISKGVNFKEDWRSIASKISFKVSFFCCDLGNRLIRDYSYWLGNPEKVIGLRGSRHQSDKVHGLTLCRRWLAAAFAVVRQFDFSIYKIRLQFWQMNCASCRVVGSSQLAFLFQSFFSSPLPQWYPVLQQSALCTSVKSGGFHFRW